MHVSGDKSKRFCWINVSEAADVESADMEANMSFSFNKTLVIWICQFLLGLR
jgi:hypothetical protein